MDSSHHSAFDRIDWPSQNHQKDCPKKVKTSIFDRLEWPSDDSLDHQMDLGLTVRLKKPQNATRDERPIEILNPNSKGKCPINFEQDYHRVLIYGKCSRASLLNPPCWEWTRCHTSPIGPSGSTLCS
jgi:hypothetical protein